MTHITTDIDQHVMVITINRPEKKNALTASMYQALSEALHTLNERDDIHVGVIKGHDGCFTAGNDLQDFIQAKTPEDMKEVKAFLRDIGHISKPSIAAIEGPAVGIGSTLLPHCDLVYAHKSAYFSLPFVNLGICVEAGNSVLLPRLVGHHHASELLLLGEKFSAEKAAQIGLINEVIEGDVADYALSQAKKIAQKPKEAILATKQLLKQHLAYEHDRIVEHENKILFDLLYTESTKKIMQSFFQ